MSFLRTSPTINLFCAGDTRHATTALQTFANFKKRCSSSSFPRIVSIASRSPQLTRDGPTRGEAGVRWGSSSKGSLSVDSCSDDLAETAAGSGVAALCTTASAVSCAPKPQSPSGPFVAPSACAKTRVTRSTWCVDGVTVAATAKAQPRTRRTNRQLDEEHVVGEQLRRLRDINGRLDLVARQHPELDLGPGEFMDRLGHAVLQSILDGRRADDLEVPLSAPRPRLICPSGLRWPSRPRAKLSKTCPSPISRRRGARAPRFSTQLGKLLQTIIERRPAARAAV